MTIGHLWYVRRAGAVKGPFPSSLIEKNIALGRILASDFVSPDGKHWEPAHSFPDFEVLRRSGEQPVIQRRLDERTRERREARAAPMTPAAAETPSDQRGSSDRRTPEEPDVIARRQRANRVWQSLRNGSAHRVRRTPLLLAAALVAVLIVAAVVFAPPPPAASDCAALAAPGVNWAFCNHAAADLRGAALGSAVLRNTRLSGADLTGADLRNADLAYADLSGAVLRDARLDGARLTGATLHGASLVDAVLTGARLDFADLGAANVAGARFDGALLDQAIMPNGGLCRPALAGSCDLGQ